MTHSRIQRLRRELDAAINSSDFELGIEVITDMIGIEPENDLHYNSKGVLYSKLGMVDEALECFNIALEINSKEPKIWYSKGCVLMDNSSLRPGLACFYKSLDLNPGFEKAKERFNRCLDEMIELGRAEEKSEVISAPWDEELEEESKEELHTTVEWTGERTKPLLDDDLFEDDEDEYEEEEEDYEEEDEYEGELEEEEQSEYKVIRCKCGNDIAIRTSKRPIRFKCSECGRKGTLT